MIYNKKQTIFAPDILQSSSSTEYLIYSFIKLNFRAISLN